MVVIIDGGRLRRRLPETLALPKILKKTCQPRDMSFIRQDAGGDDQDPAKSDPAGHQRRGGGGSKAGARAGQFLGGG